jgi:hypothetical protein
MSFHRYDGASRGFFYYHTPHVPARGGHGRLGKVFGFFGRHLSSGRYGASLASTLRSAAMRASWTREVMPSFQKMWRRWNATV